MFCEEDDLESRAVMREVAPRLKGKILLATNSFLNELSDKMAELLGVSENMVPKVRLFK